ncbi:MAG: alanine racemase [Candidatus Omnitrophica bacterium]|nr:alanine racemase [Candidatus Omnitrophota bacterium]MCB9747567.1 alanine racemase [Candidatus Omnitrophota bacterium]
MNKLTWVEINLKAVEHNVRCLRVLAKKNKFYLPTRRNSKKYSYSHSQILAVIKADAYGHGAEQIGLLLQKEGIDYFAVSDVAEGIKLRKSGIKRPILLLESTLNEFVKEIFQYQLTPTICTYELALALQQRAKKLNRRCSIHIKVDTGMGRLGVWHQQAYEFIGRIHQLRNLTIHGLYTHFPAADTNHAFTREQIQTFYNLILRLDKSGIVIPFIHAANSMGLAGYKTHVLNLVRPGLMLYGLYPQDKLKTKIHLKPVMSIKSRIIFLKNIEKGRSISYGRKFIARQSMKVATLPIGYSDGYSRLLSNKGDVLIKGQRCPILGAVTMDQIVVDVSKVPNLQLGMPVTILGREGKEEVAADELARLAGTINYEIVCNLGNRLAREYV